MTPFCKTLNLIFVLLAVLLVAGCAGQADDGKSAGGVALPVSITSSISTPTQIEIYQVLPDCYWIKIDPISDKYVGESFTISSTTNLSTGTEVLVQVYSSNFHPGIQMQTREFSGATGTVRVVNGMNGINTISFVVDSSTLYNSSLLKPGEYIVTEDAVIQPVTGTIFFNVLPAPKSSGNIMLKP
jgi:hypothetical protein